MEMSIGEVAKRAGLSSSAIRYYEREGLIGRARRRAGRRVYEAEILDRLRIIELAKNAGFTIAETRRLLHGFSSDTEPGERWRALAVEKMAELDRRINEARRMRQVLEAATRCRCPSFEDCAQALAEAQDRPSGGLDAT